MIQRKQLGHLREKIMEISTEDDIEIDVLNEVDLFINNFNTEMIFYSLKFFLRRLHCLLLCQVIEFDQQLVVCLPLEHI